MSSRGCGMDYGSREQIHRINFIIMDWSTGTLVQVFILSYGTCLGAYSCMFKTKIAGVLSVEMQLLSFNMSSNFPNVQHIHFRRLRRKTTCY